MRRNLRRKRKLKKLRIKKKSIESLQQKCYLLCLSSPFLIIPYLQRRRRGEGKKNIKPLSCWYTQILYNEITQCTLNSKIHHARKKIFASASLSTALEIVSRPISWNLKWLVYAILGNTFPFASVYMLFLAILIFFFCVHQKKLLLFYLSRHILICWWKKVDIHRIKIFPLCLTSHIF